MRILLLSSYFYPEQVGSGIWVHQLACELKAMGHDVSVLTTFPSYPEGRIFPQYRRRFFMREIMDGIEVTRTFTYATPSKRFWPRIASFGSFCVSSLMAALTLRRRLDVVYAVLPPLPLGLSAWALAKMSGAKLVVNVQDIYPDIAVALGVLRNRRAIDFFARMERWIYGHADRIVAISEGFRANITAKGVPGDKVHVVPNWADPNAILPGPRENAFRREHGIGNEFVVLYSGGLSHNSHLEPVLDAAAELGGEPFLFLIAGEGVRKDSLMRLVNERGLANVRFYPFQPLHLYPEALAAADVTLVTLHSAATFASVPSKIFKQMAAARPVLAIADPRSEVARLIEESGCGVSVAPDNTAGLVAALRDFAARPEQSAHMGRAGREYVTAVCSPSRCVSAIQTAFAKALA